nr:IX protein [Lemur mastadenovirus]WGN96488.1 IX protein [Lemur mastadenovirus]WGN96522.1 IX protein [Lemur mastadenovirus]
MSGTAGNRGAINTSFLTVRLPSWAGVRQDIEGSDVTGRPVRPSNEMSIASSPATASSAGIAVVPVETLTTFNQPRGITDEALEEEITELHLSVTDLENAVEALTRQMANLSERIDEMAQRLLNLAGTAPTSPAASVSRGDNDYPETTP